ncbi:GlyGly-CTERM sorting domain-containing protein [Alcanivorax sp. IO_7]|nr:GlyGly-CTERM sorting domain-containing protein [Alcanivorax sp. IO_7]
MVRPGGWWPFHAAGTHAERGGRAGDGGDGGGSGGGGGGSTGLLALLGLVLFGRRRYRCRP